MKRKITSFLLTAVTMLALCTSVLAAPAQTARHWQVYVENGSIYCKGPENATTSTPVPIWQPTWLPEGWTLDMGSIWGGAFPAANWTYSNGEESLYFRCCPPFDFSFCCWMDSEAGGKATKLQTKIQGYQANLWQINKESALAWEDQQGNLFLLLHSGSLTQANLEKIAGSMKEVSEALPEYRLGWTPNQDRELTRSTAMPGYIQDTGGTPDFIRFTYAAQPLTAPAKTPETVMVRGTSARLWLGDQSAKGFAVSSSVSGKTAEIPTEETWSTLIWTDPETNICFCIQGNKLTKETMLRMAESTELAQTTPKLTQSTDVKKTSGSDAVAPDSNDPNASRQSWVADGWKATIVRADGTIERVPNFSELFPGRELPVG